MKKIDACTAPGPPDESFNPARRALVRASALFAAASVCSPTILRAATPTIRIGHVSPITGFLAGFAEAQGWVLEGVRKYLAQGLEIGSRIYPIEIITRDSQSDQSRAADVASVLSGKPPVYPVRAG